MIPVNRKSNIFSKIFKVFGIALVITGLMLSSFNQQASADPEGMVTICHAAGLDGTTQYVELTLNANAVYGPAGHFSEPGTPNAGHEDDYEGPCDEEDIVVTICYLGQTLEVNQAELEEYPGYSEGECSIPETVTICYNGTTMEVDKEDLGDYPGYSDGECSLPDLVTICFRGQAMQVERSELENYPGYNLDKCETPESIKICYKGVSKTVLVSELNQYPGYNLDKCEVVEEDPEEEEEVVEPLSIPVEMSSNLLIPVTGSDITTRLFGNGKATGLVGMGMVLTGLGFAYKGSKKKNQ